MAAHDFLRHTVHRACYWRQGSLTDKQSCGWARLNDHHFESEVAVPLSDLVPAAAFQSDLDSVD
jgi:hypothetical protein